MIVDIHVHMPLALRGATRLEQLIPETEHMLAVAERAGIDKQVVLGLTYGDASNRLLRDLVARYPDHLVPFMWGSFVDKECPALLERAVCEYGFKGLKLPPEDPAFPLTGILGAHAIYDKAAELGVPVLLHSWHQEEGLTEVLPTMHSGWFPMLVLDELGKQHPDTTFIIAHSGGMWVKAAQAARPHPNIVLDVCGFDPERGIVEELVGMIGAERVYWGSDVPGRSYVAQLAKVKYADISEADKALILGGNAARLLNLR